MAIDKAKRKTLATLGVLALTPMLPVSTHGSIPPLKGFTMGTGFSIQIGAVPFDVSLKQLKREIEKVLENVQSSMSTYRTNSEISILNRLTHHRWQPLSSDMERVLAAALNVSDQSGGAFSPVMGSLVSHWGFGPQPNTYPDYSVRALRKMTDATNSSSIELKPRRIRKTKSEAILDLNAIAKGDAIDQIGELLKSFGVNNFLIEIGGEVLSAGIASDGAPWKIGIEKPDGGIFNVVSLDNQSIATSGDYTDYYIRHGTRYSHLIDPYSGQPVAHDLAAVSVIADQAMYADAWATALLVMGPKRGLELALDTEMPVLFVQRVNDAYKTVITPHFKKRLN